jgi:small subunit ribosomal protein S3Ae
MSAQKKRTKSQRGRQIDKWSLKQLYTIISPEDLEIGNAKGSPIGETIGADPDTIIGRILEVPLSDLTQKFSLVHIKLQFRISEIIGTTAKTKFVGHSYANDFIRSLVKRRRTRVDAIININTKDNISLRTTSTAFTVRRAKSSHKHEIRKKMLDIIELRAKELTFVDFVTKMIRGDLNGELFEACQKIYPLTQIEVQKSKVLTKWI